MLLFQSLRVLELKGVRFSSSRTKVLCPIQPSSLKEFLESFEGTGLDVPKLITQSSKVKGTFYEYSVKETLKRRFDIPNLVVFGGSNDRGLDLAGVWNTETFGWDSSRKADSTFEKYVDLKVQCKHISAPIEPKYIRELLGTHAYYYSATRNFRDVFFFCATNRLTKSSIEQFNKLNVPVFFFKINPFRYKGHGRNTDISNYEFGDIENFLMNQKAQDLFNGSKLNEIMTAFLVDGSSILKHGSDDFGRAFKSSDSNIRELGLARSELSSNASTTKEEVTESTDPNQEAGDDVIRIVTSADSKL